jgi:hypothetical protein
LTGAVLATDAAGAGVAFGSGAGGAAAAGAPGVAGAGAGGVGASLTAAAVFPMFEMLLIRSPLAHAATLPSMH